MGFREVLSLNAFLFLTLGVFLGLIVGAIPGLNDNITLAILIPITFGMDAKIAMMLLVGVYASACYGGSLPAILLKIPGTASSVVTCRDGYAMTLKGEANQALGISAVSSVFGGIMSSLVLIFFAPFLARQALRFGPPEYFALTILGISTVVGMSNKKYAIKNLIACVLGLLFSMVGMSTQTGFPRFWFNNDYLLEGIPFIPMLIGLFGVASILELSETINKEMIGKVKLLYKSKSVRILPSRKMVKRLFPTWVISGGIGNIIGIIPGAGMLMAIYLSYDQAKRMNKDKIFGTGIPEGIAAPEAANNAVVASSMVPLLALGIPGNSASALFVGALMIQGLRPGPALFKNYPEVAYSILVGFLVANILMGPMGIILGKFLVKYIFIIPRSFLSGAILLLCITGSFAMGNSIFNIGVMLFFAIVGYIFNKFNLSMSGFILAIVLGPIMETNFLQSMILSKGNPFIFLERGLSFVLLFIAFCFIFSPLLTFLKNNKKKLIKNKLH